MLNPRWLPWLAILTVLVTGCHTSNYTYTDPKYQVSIHYPGNLDLISDGAILGQVSEPANERAVDHPELLFVLGTPEQSQMTCAVHRLPASLKMSAQEYYQASTSQELQRIGAEIVEPMTDVEIGGKTFQRVGFTVKTSDLVIRARIYQHLDVATGRVLVLTPTIDAGVWEREISLLEPVISSVEIAW